MHKPRAVVPYRLLVLALCLALTLSPSLALALDVQDDILNQAASIRGLAPKAPVPFELADPANTSLGHKTVQRWNLPDGWVISARPAHPALVSEADFIAAQDINAARGPAPRAALAAPGNRRYLLAGLLACGTCGRRMESAWSNGNPAYRCRHGHTSAAAPDPARPKNAYIREDRILAHLPALHLLLTGSSAVAGRRRRTRRGADTRPQAGAEDVIGYLRDRGITLTYDPAAGTLQAGTCEAAKTVIRKAS